MPLNSHAIVRLSVALAMLAGYTEAFSTLVKVSDSALLGPNGMTDY